jgi:transcriptional regulator of nitric oxide reductase/ferredoxin
MLPTACHPTCRLICALLAAMVALGAQQAAAAGAATVTPQQLAAIFPGAERLGSFEGTPPAAAVYRDGAVAGYVFSTFAVIGSTGYSGKPIDVLAGVAGVDRSATITGALLVRSTEPILVIGVTEAQLSAYVSGFAGIDLQQRITAGDTSGVPDAISGATVSSAVIRDAIIRAGRAVARSRGLFDAGRTIARLDRETTETVAWPDLVADGSVAMARFAEAREGGSGLVLELYAALLTPPRIGESLLGPLAYNRAASDLGPDDHLILIAANGRVSIKGTGFVRSGRFDRLQIVQGDQTIPLTTDGYTNIEALKTEGAPELREAGVFTLRASSGFDPLQPWRVDVSVAIAPGQPPSLLSLDYRLPDRYRIAPPPGADGDGSPLESTLWQQNWRDNSPRIMGVTLMLAVLTAMLVLQTSVVRRPMLYRRGRIAFLAVTLGWLGWVAGGQLSVVNVLTFSHALMSEFNWSFFLVEPVIFLLWSYAAVALLFLGRGVYCGWLCPFGALQELLSEVARRVRLPQLTVPFAIHERLWPIKYVIFLGLFALSLSSMTDAFWLAEVEPFKTAISLRFLREWPFVAYAVGLLAIGLFINRFFCRYLCPLGAALAIPARLRMFDWLKRRPQCGRECQVCFARCPVQAIHPEGQINPNECIHCLKCQSIYLDATICPPLAAQRKRRERREALSAGQPVAMDPR